MATTQTQAEFTRISWSSINARDTWEPRIKRIQEALTRIEIELVKDGQRALSIQHVAPDNLVEFTDAMHKLGLLVFPCGRAGNSTYSSRTQTAFGSGYTYRVKVARSNDYFNPDINDANIGRLLGYPECCVKFFDEVWNKQRKMDTTLEMLKAGGPNGPAECNMLLRWLGVRFVFHLPCSFQCRDTYDLGSFHRSFAVKLGFRQEVNWAMEMLHWPTRYSALHGAAEIVTPFVKITASTDYTASRVEFEREGIVLPDQSHLAKENGFPSIAFMDVAHDPILQTIEQLFDKDEAIHVLDVGCGNGILLEKIHENFPAGTLYGIEVDPDKAESARAKGVIVRTANVSDPDVDLVKGRYPFDLVLCSVERFKEDPNLEARVKSWGKLLMVYDYSKHPTQVRMTRDYM